MADDLEREPPATAAPAAGAPTAGAPTAGAPTADGPAAEGPGAATAGASAAPAPRKTSAARVWVILVAATVLLILLIIFIAENSRSVTISFLGASGRISLALALLIAAVVGVVVALLAGTARILQLRLEVRRHRRSAATLQRARSR